VEQGVLATACVAIIVIGIRQEMVMTFLRAVKTEFGKTHSEVRKLVVMHEHPDDYGFGTGGHVTKIHEGNVKMDKVAEETRATNRLLRELIFYQKQRFRADTGNEPEPYLEDNCS